MLNEGNMEARLFKIAPQLIVQLSFTNLNVIMGKNNYAELNAGGVPHTLVENCCPIIIITVHRITLRQLS